RSGPNGTRDQRKDVGVSGNGYGDAARPDQRKARYRSGSRVFWFFAVVSVHGPDEPAFRNHAEAASLGPRSGRSLARAGRIRSARRASDSLWTDLSNRNAGRSEHWIDFVAELLCTNQ